MRIAVIGTGHVGGALGIGWAQAGRQVVFGTREPEAVENRRLREASPNISLASVADAVSAADVVALAVPWSAVEEITDGLACLLTGKLLIDCTNPVREWSNVDHSSGSGGEQVASAKVVKAFNTTGFENLENPRYPNGAVTMFYAGDDGAAKAVVHELVSELGFDAVDAGGLSQSHTREVLASFWGTLAYGQKMGRGIAFRLMRR